jgi:hypothetical protein
LDIIGLFLSRLSVEEGARKPRRWARVAGPFGAISSMKVATERRRRYREHERPEIEVEGEVRQGLELR